MFVCNIMFNLFHIVDVFRKSKNTSSTSKGVYKENTGNTGNKLNIVYYYSKRKPMGVRKHGIDIYFKDRSVSYNCIPCLCGSPKHRRTYHRECLLNPQYDDF